jgi:hypothetical protein
MELVRGVKITDYCDEARLSTRERLDLFVQVCHAIQHAHQKGIIHRDLKPSNILVTVNDGMAVPKVIDFGIAKATTDQRLTDKTLFTAYEQFIGTPAYMSPEQAVMTSLDVDTRTDIYSLGVLLYELLTGKTPFDPGELVQAGFDEMRRTIREDEPARPSTKVSTMRGADLTTVAKRRQLDAPRLVHLLRGDLDWIAMKALEKDRTRRYETANALATDIRRFLNNELVEARPPSTFYRFQKLVRRNKTVFAAVSAVAAALVIGLSLSLYLFIRERDAHQRAVAAEKEQARLREQAEAGRALEAQMRQQAEIGKQYADAGLMLSQRRFSEAENLMVSLPPHPAAASIFSVLGTVHAARTEWAGAITNYSKVIALIPDDHLAYHFLAALFIQTGDAEGYRRHCAEILRRFGATTNAAIAERTTKDCSILPPPAPELPAIARLADTAIAAGPTHKSWPYFEFAKGLSEYRQGHFADAVEWLQKIVDLKSDKYRAVQAHMTLAMAQHHLKQNDEARATLAKGLAIAEARFPKVDQGLDEQWQDWIFAHALMREAKALIGGNTRATGN